MRSLYTQASGKWLVLAAALLLALAGALKLRDKAVLEKAALLSGQPEQPGGPLPGGNTQYYIPAEFSAVPTRSGAPSAYGALPVIKQEIYDKGPCKGGSLNEMLSSHGRIWGYLAPYGSFQHADTSEVYDLLGRYLSCVGLARGDPAFCDYLPREGRRGKFEVDRFSSPNSKCRGYYMNVSFPGFSAGRDKAEASCRIFQTEGSLAIVAQVPAEDFCAAAASGMEGMCGALSEFIPEELSAKCRRVLPSGISDCGADRNCSSRLAIYGAMRSGDAGACPEDYRGLCSAFLSGTEASCPALLAKLGSSYCAYLAKAQKRAGGYAGFSPEEVKEAIKKDAEAKTNAERQRLENQKITEEINKRVRKLMGK